MTPDVLITALRSHPEFILRRGLSLAGCLGAILTLATPSAGLTSDAGLAAKHDTPRHTGLAQTAEGRAPAGHPPEPPGHRDPARQPFSSFSLWNTALGDGARWSSADDADTRDLHRPEGTIAAGEWSIPIFVAASTDPLVAFRVKDGLFPVPTLMQHLPVGAAPSPPKAGGDHHMVMFEADKHHLTHYFGCSTSGRGFTCALGQRDSTCGDGLGDYGWGSGLIRKWEIEAGAIRHVLRYSLSKTATKAGPTWLSGVAWPAQRSDYEGPALYKGHVLYGSTVGIPASVDLSSLGLSAHGMTLARALQDYGAIQRDTGGDHGINFYAEQDAEGMPALEMMRADLARIIPHLAILRNQSPSSIGGGGARRQPLLPGIDRAVCP